MTRTVPILLYHSVADKVAPRYSRWAVSPALFAAHLAYIHKVGYTPLTVTQFVQHMTSAVPLPAKPVVLSFDDGLGDFYTGALPILRQYHFPATLYITTGYVEGVAGWLAEVDEGNRPMMSWAQIAQLPAHNIECGAHTHRHLPLDTLPRAQALREITHSKTLLEEKLGQPVHSFAYPHGYHDKVVYRMVQEAGFTSACGVKHALSAPDDDRFALARVIVAGNTTVNELAGLLAGRGLARAPKRERIRTKIWRWVRRWRAHRQTAFSAAAAPIL